MLVFTEADMVARGSHRGIFLNDDFKNKCFKIVIARKKGAWWKRIRPLSWYSENIKEIKTYKLIEKKNDPKIFDFIPNFYGVIKTNLGDAMLIDYIGDSMSIKEYIAKYGLTEQLKKSLMNMFRVFYKNNVQIRDQHLNNYLVKMGDGGDVSVKLIDGIGSSQLIPLADHVPFIGRRQLLRRINKLFNAIYEEFPDYRGSLKFDREDATAGD